MTVRTIPDPAPSELERSEQKRREVVDAARRVIVERGLEAASLRRIAAEAGFTTGFVSHYYPDKQAVIVACFEAASADWIAAVRAALEAAVRPEDKLQALVKMAIPTDPGARAEWRLWAEMWAYAGRDPLFASTLVETDARWESLIRDTLRGAQEGRVIRDSLVLASEASVVARLIDGLGLRAWLSGRWDDARAQLVYHLATLGVDDDLQASMLSGAGRHA